MKNFDVFEFANLKAKRISEILSEKYDSADFEIGSKVIYKELQQRSEQEAKSCFVLNTEAKFDEKVINDLNYYVSIRIEHKKYLDEMDIEEKLSFVIVYLTVDYLSENDRIFLF